MRMGGAPLDKEEHHKTEGSTFKPKSLRNRAKARRRIPEKCKLKSNCFFKNTGEARARGEESQGGGEGRGGAAAAAEEDQSKRGRRRRRLGRVSQKFWYIIVNVLENGGFRKAFFLDKVCSRSTFVPPESTRTARGETPAGAAGSTNCQSAIMPLYRIFSILLQNIPRIVDFREKEKEEVEERRRQRRAANKGSNNNNGGGGARKL